MLLSNDIVLVRQFVVGLLIPNPAYDEFQRIDSAPLLTGGDGQIDATDTVQARRYVAGLDSPRGANGPTGPTARPADQNRFDDSLLSRVLNISSESAAPGQRVTVYIGLDKLGDETAASFTLEFDPSTLKNPHVSLAGGNPDSTVLTTNDTCEGRTGVLVDSMETLSGNLLVFSFDVDPNASGETPVRFSDSIAVRSVAGTFAERLPARFNDGSVSIRGNQLPVLEMSGRVLAPDGRGLRNATVVLANENGVFQTVITSTFGYYRFVNLQAGRDYLIAVESKRFSFRPRMVVLTQDVSDMDFEADP